MKGFPKTFNTKQDVLNCIDVFPEKTKAFLRNALAGYKDWVCTGIFENESDCIKNDTHDYSSQEYDGKISWIQKEFMVVPGNIIDRLEFTTEEIKGFTE